MISKFRILFLLLSFSISCLAQHKSLFKIIEGDKIGYIDSTGRVEIQTKFISGFDFSEGLAAVRITGRYGFIDSSGHFVIQPKYDFATNFNKGIACVYMNGKPVFIDKNDKIIFDTEYSTFQFINARKAIVQTKTRKLGLIDLNTNKLLVDTVFKSIKKFENGVLIVTKEKTTNENDSYNLQYGVTDSMGNFIVNLDKYYRIKDFVNGYALVEIQDSLCKEGNIDGLIDTKGNLLFQRPPKNRSYILEDFYNGLAIVGLYKYWIPEEEGVASMSEKRYQGYINLKGEVILNDTSVKSLTSFSDNRAFIRYNNKEGYTMIDTKLNKVGKDIYDNIRNEGFKNGYANVEKNGKWGIIDISGKFIGSYKYKFIDEMSIVGDFIFYGIYDKDYRGLFGITSLSGKEIMKQIIQDFDRSGFVNGLLKLIVNNKLTYINKKGKIVWQEKKEPIIPLIPLNIDFMNRGYFSAYSKPNEKDIGGFARSNNLPQLIHLTDNFQKNKLSVTLMPTEKDTFDIKYKALKVYIANTFDENIEFNAQNSRLNMLVQAQNSIGEWKDIEYLPSSWCGNSYHTLTLETNRFWTFLTPVYDGEFKTKLRIVLKYIDPTYTIDTTDKRRNRKEIQIYSNEYEGSINPGQFWNKKIYSSNGIMDPYDD